MIAKLAVTGHRPDKLGGYGPQAYEKLFQFAFRTLGQLEPQCVITGMAQGWDTAVAEAAFVRKIPYLAYVPFEGQERKWPTQSQTLYRNLLAGADGVKVISPNGYSVQAMYDRNIAMVNDGDEILALFNGDSTGGTAHAYNYALAQKKPVHNVWSQWVRVR